MFSAVLSVPRWQREHYGEGGHERKSRESDRRHMIDISH
jgi:hypothetical protein